MAFAPQCTGRAGRGAFELLRASGCGAAECESPGGQLQRGGPAGLSSAAVVEAVAVRLLSGDHLESASGAAHPRGLRLPLSGGRVGAGLLDVERVPAPSCKSVERSVHTGSGVGPGAGLGTAGSRGRRFHPDRGECFARSYRHRGATEEPARRSPTTDPAMAEAV